MLRSWFLVQYQHSETGRHLILFIVYLQSISFDMHYTVSHCIPPIPCYMYTKCGIVLWWRGLEYCTMFSFQSSIDICSSSPITSFISRFTILRGWSVFIVFTYSSTRAVRFAGSFFIKKRHAVANCCTCKLIRRWIARACMCYR